MRIEQPACQHCASRNKSLFHYCHLSDIENIDNAKSCSVYKRGQVIFQEGSKAPGLYCINTGKVKITKEASDAKEQIIRFAKPGDFLGYCTLLAGNAYPASAVAIEDATICLVPKEVFSELLETNKLFSDNIVKLLCKTVENSVEKMTDLAYKPVRGRIAEALLFLNRFYQEESNPKGRISISREELASFVGTVKETAIRTLKEFKDDNLIETHGTEIEIKDVNGLLHISELYD